MISFSLRANVKAVARAMTRGLGISRMALGMLRLGSRQRLLGSGAAIEIVGQFHHLVLSVGLT